jgi:hypothetical protein
MDVYWFDDHGGVRLPKACRLKCWDGNAFVDVPNTTGLGMKEHSFNVTTFPEITTTRLRLEFDGQGESSTGILEWRVYDSGKSPNFPPIVSAGVDRTVVQPGETFLSGKVKDDGKPRPRQRCAGAKSPASAKSLLPMPAAGRRRRGSRPSATMS